MSNKSVIAIIVLLAILLPGCQTSNQQQNAVTSAPSEVVATQIPPTETSAPPTDTPVPTHTPLPTATPGPIVIRDDFSSQTDNWGDCEKCEWKDGALLFGPYPPRSGADQIFYVICNTCGVHTYYRVSVDVTFFEGYGDRTFGVMAGLTEDKDLIAAGTVSTFKDALYEAFNYSTKQWVSGTFKHFNAVGAGRATNRIVVEIKPASDPGSADINVSVNETTVISLLDQPVEPSWAGLYLGWHTVGASYDNFEYEEIPLK